MLCRRTHHSTLTMQCLLYRQIRRKTVSRLLAESYLLYTPRNKQSEQHSSIEKCVTAVRNTLYSRRPINALERHRITINLSVINWAPDGMFKQTNETDIKEPMAELNRLLSEYRNEFSVTPLAAASSTSIEPNELTDERFNRLLAADADYGIDLFEQRLNRDQQERLLPALLAYQFNWHAQVERALRIYCRHCETSRELRDELTTNRNALDRFIQLLSYYLSRDRLDSAKQLLTDLSQTHAASLQDTRLLAGQIELYGRLGEQLKCDYLFQEYREHRRSTSGGGSSSSNINNDDALIATAMFHGPVRDGDVKGTLTAFHSMIKSGLVPTEQTFICLLRLFGEQKFAEGVGMIHSLALNSSQLSEGNALSGLYWRRAASAFLAVQQPAKVVELAQQLAFSSESVGEQSDTGWRLQALLPYLVKAKRQLLMTGTCSNDAQQLPPSIENAMLYRSPRAAAALVNYLTQSSSSGVAGDSSLTEQAVGEWLQARMDHRYAQLLHLHYRHQSLIAKDYQPPPRALSLFIDSWCQRDNRALSVLDAYRVGMIALGSQHDTDAMCQVFADMLRRRVYPDQHFFQTWISQASHAANVPAALMGFQLFMLYLNHADPQLSAQLLDQFPQSSNYSISHETITEWLATLKQQQQQHRSGMQSSIPACERAYPPMQCFNDLIRAYGMQGDAKRALQWHEKIEASLRRLPGISTYTAINYVHDLDEMSPQVANLLLDTACHRTLSRMRHTPKDGGGEEELILGKRLAVGAEPDNNNNLDDESASAAAILPPGIGVCNSAMWAFGRTGNIRMAAKLMDLMLRHWHRQPTMTTWNGFMLAYVRSGDHQNALNLWRYIVEHYQLSSTSNTDGNDNVRINQRTVSLVLQTCAELGEREAAKQLLAVAIKQRKSANTSDPDIFPAERPFDHLWRRTMIQHARRCQLVEEQFSDLQFPEFLKVSGCIAFEDLRRYHELMDNKELVARMEDIARDSTNLTPEQCHELFATIKLSS